MTKQSLFIWTMAVYTWATIATTCSNMLTLNKQTSIELHQQNLSDSLAVMLVDSSGHLELTGPSITQWQRNGPGDEYEVACFFETKYKDTTWLSTKRGNVAYQVGDEPTIVIDSADLKKIKKAIEGMRMPARWSNEVPL